MASLQYRVRLDLEIGNSAPSGASRFCKSLVEGNKSAKALKNDQDDWLDFST